MSLRQLKINSITFLIIQKVIKMILNRIMDINELRRKNLRALVEEFGGVGKLAEVANRDQSQISQWLNGSIIHATGKPRGVRSSTLRDFEAAIGKPLNWLDQDHADDEPIKDGYIELTYYDIQSSAGPGKVAPVDYTPILDRKIWVLEDWALRNFGRGAIDKIRIIDNVGDSMSPTINNGDVLFVDVTQREYVADGIYIINWNGRLLTKRLRAMIDGRLAIISDNKDQYDTEYVSEKDMDQLVICGFVKKWWSLRG
ncbi:S24 family peptidase [Pelistega suis]|uniref:S24 family peptidase n=1 Tax=Pelistega suis TaxID=1631957 RepID=A0A849P416_9BURK|nr:S24 family peptidase [Pelistega suis]NOL51806.1 S24 family peptidase [Pelistega suis]